MESMRAQSILPLLGKHKTFLELKLHVRDTKQRIFLPYRLKARSKESKKDAKIRSDMEL